MKKLNLRIRLMLSAIAIALVVFTVAGVLSWKECQEKVAEFFDTYQLSLARGLSSTDWDDVSEYTQQISNQIIKSVHNADEEDEAIGFAVFDNIGNRIFHDNKYGKYFSPFGRNSSFSTERIGKEKWRVIRVMSTDKNFIIAVGQELDYRNEIVEEMFEEFMIPWIIGLFLMLIAMMWVLTIEFRPLNKLAKNLQNRHDSDLSPLNETDIPSEIKPLTRAVNHLLKKIDGMITRERSFIADAAHELRSPLTALKVQLEVAEMTADKPHALSDSFRKLEQGIARSSRLVEQLLILSRIESGEVFEPEILNWQQLIQQIIDEYKSEISAKQINIQNKFTKAAFLTQGNAFLISLMLRNLVDNAVKYSPNGAKIEIKLNNQSLSVCNSGIKVDEEQLSKLGQRFYRPSGQTAKGSGLGLAIVHKIASAHHCQTKFYNTKTGFCVSIFN
ncbi:MAG: sensor histidine kinase N-terminal domain-containing protein [Alphaproteobacteria bacterium]|nr:sensor histidine kinase N-terminal domain-containing protein [Alphaproteobacteria bacterium]